MGERQDAVAKNREGVRLLAARDHKGAIAAFSEAISLDPNFSTSYRNRATAFEKAGKFTESAADLAKLRTTLGGPRTDISESEVHTSLAPEGVFLGGIIGGILFVYIGAYLFVMVGAVAGAVIGGKRGGFVSGLWYFFIGAFAAGFVVNTVAYSLGEVLVGIAVVIVCALFGGMAGSIRGAMHRVTGKP